MLLDYAPAGTHVKVLLQKCLHSILGSALPYKETGDAEERALANTVTAGGLLLKHLTGKLQNTPGPAVSHFAMQTQASALSCLHVACNVRDKHDWIIG